MNDAKMLMIHEQKKQDYEKFIESFTKQVTGIFNSQEDALWGLSGDQAQYIGTIAVLINMVGIDGAITIPPDVLEEINENEFYVKVNKNDDGSVTYSLINEEDTDNADPNSGENLQVEV